MLRLIPKEEKFFEMLKESAQCVLKGAIALKDLAENYTDVEKRVKEIKDIEHQGDKIMHKIAESLNKTFVTPFDREDIYSLASELDNVLDAIEGISSRLLNFKIANPTSECIQLVNIIYKAVVEIEKAVGDIKHIKNLKPFCVEINSLENEADQISQKMIGMLLDKEQDWRSAIKWKEIYGRMESAADHCENIADVIETIVVKNA